MSDLIDQMTYPPEFQAYWRERQRRTWPDPEEPVPELWGYAFKPHTYEGWLAGREFERAALAKAGA